jgi:hypothetical protein
MLGARHDLLHATLLAHEELAARIAERHRRAAKSGKSYDEVLAADVEAGDKRTMAKVERRRRQRGHFLGAAALVSRSNRRPEPPRMPRRTPEGRRVASTRRTVRRRARAPGRKSDDPHEPDPPLEDRRFPRACARGLPNLPTKQPASGCNQVTSAAAGAREAAP